MASKSYEIAFQLGAKLNGSFANAFKKAQDKIMSFTKGIGSAVINSTGAAVNMAASSFGGAMEVYKGFEQSMANTSAIAGITKSSEAYAFLERAALDAGKATSKTAQEAADALGYMALAGWSVEDSSKALMPVLERVL